MQVPVPTLTIDVFADVVCPWCYIGEQRLMRAVERLRAAQPDVSVEPRWRPFQLQPDLPPEGLPWQPFAEQKFGSWSRARANFRYVERAAANDGLAFNFEAIPWATNTMQAHRLILYARVRDRGWAMAEALFAAYFTHGVDVGDTDQLVHQAEAVGLDPGETRAFLASDLGREDVVESQRVAGELGITGVPFYIIGGRYGVSGAQPVDVLVQALEATLAETTSEG